LPDSGAVLGARRQFGASKFNRHCGTRVRACQQRAIRRDFLVRLRSRTSPSQFSSQGPQPCERTSGARGSSDRAASPRVHLGYIRHNPGVLLRIARRSVSSLSKRLAAHHGTRRNALEKLAMQKVVGSNPISCSEDVTTNPVWTRILKSQTDHVRISLSTGESGWHVFGAPY
jgi:hypothetical protein